MYVCDRWQNSFQSFFDDMGERPEGKTIDRIDPQGNYEPSNCKWSTRQEQIWNQAKTIKVVHEGQMIALTDACERLCIPLSLVYSRMKRGISFERAITPSHMREKKTDENLRKFVRLRKSGWSMADLADHFGISQSGLEKWSRDAISRGWYAPIRASELKRL